MWALVLESNRAFHRFYARLMEFSTGPGFGVKYGLVDTVTRKEHYYQISEPVHHFFGIRLICGMILKYELCQGLYKGFLKVASSFKRSSNGVSS